MVRVQWCEAGSPRNGQVSLQGLRLPLSAFSIVRPVPLLFGERFVPGAHDRPHFLAWSGNDTNWGFDI